MEQNDPKNRKTLAKNCLRNGVLTEGQDYSFIYLTKKEMLDPRPVMTAFCLKYPIVYARRELWDFFQAAESYSGPFRAHVSKYIFSEYYLKLLTLVEAAYAITRQVPDEE